MLGPPMQYSEESPRLARSQTYCDRSSIATMTQPSRPGPFSTTAAPGLRPYSRQREKKKGWSYRRVRKLLSPRRQLQSEGLGTFSDSKHAFVVQDSRKSLLSRETP